MSSQSKQLVKIIADIAIALEFTDETLINPDVAIEMQESIAGTLQSLDVVARSLLKDAEIPIRQLKYVTYCCFVPERINALMIAM